MFNYIPEFQGASGIPDIGGAIQNFLAAHRWAKELSLKAMGQGVFQGGLTPNGHPTQPTADQDGGMPGDTSGGFLSGAQGFPTSGIGVKLPSSAPQSPLTPPSGIGIRMHDPNQPGDTTGNPNQPFVGGPSIMAEMFGGGAASANAAAQRPITGNTGSTVPPSQTSPNAPTATGGDASLGMPMPAQPAPHQAMSSGAAQAVAQMAQGGQQGTEQAVAQMAQGGQQGTAQAVAQMAQGGQQGTEQGHGAAQSQAPASGQAGGQGGVDFGKLGQVMQNYQPPSFTIGGGPWKGATYMPGAAAIGQMGPQIIRAMVESGLLAQRGEQQIQNTDEHGRVAEATAGPVAGAKAAAQFPWAGPTAGAKAAATLPYEQALMVSPHWVSRVALGKLGLQAQHLGLDKQKLGNDETDVFAKTPDVMALQMANSAFKTALQPALQGARDGNQYMLKPLMLQLFAYSDAGAKVSPRLAAMAQIQPGMTPDEVSAKVDAFLSAKLPPEALNMIQNAATLDNQARTGPNGLYADPQTGLRAGFLLAHPGDEQQLLAVDRAVGYTGPSMATGQPSTPQTPTPKQSNAGDPIARLQAQYQAALARGVDSTQAKAIFDRESAKLQGSH